MKERVKIQKMVMPGGKAQEEEAAARKKRIIDLLDKSDIYFFACVLPSGATGEIALGNCDDDKVLIYSVGTMWKNMVHDHNSEY